MSNIFLGGDVGLGNPKSDVTSRLATSVDVVPAMRLILGANGRLADEGQVRDFLRFAARRGGVLSDIWVVLAGGEMFWAVMPMLSAGRTMLLFSAPAVFAGDHLSAVQSTIGAVCKQFGERDVQLAQILVDPNDRQTIEMYGRCGFGRMAELIYLQRNLRRAAGPGELPGEFWIQEYSAQTHDLFAQAIVASYEDSLDCPPLNGTRGIADIMAGHQAAGEFNPRDWFLLLHRTEPVGVLLLNRTLAGDGMELVYLGLAPKVRGHGLGEYLLRLAESRVCQRKLGTLTLAVDSMNEPALKLYYRHGMQRVASKVAMMRIVGR